MQIPNEYKLETYDMNYYLFDLLNIIKRDNIKRRLKRELEIILSLKDKYLDIISIDNDDNDNPVITIIDEKSNFDNKEYFGVYNFIIPQNYPFEPPKIKINGVDYFVYLNIKSLLFKEILKNMTDLNCLCCNSYACSDNWAPIVKLETIIYEIREMRKKKINIIYKCYADKIKLKYLIDDIDLDQWLF